MVAVCNREVKSDELNTESAEFYVLLTVHPCIIL